MLRPAAVMGGETALESSPKRTRNLRIGWTLLGARPIEFGQTPHGKSGNISSKPHNCSQQLLTQWPNQERICEGLNT
jgi:hypothetical protein